jgi:hypothetical protein
LLELNLPKAIPEVSSEKEIDEDANILSELESWKLLNNGTNYDNYLFYMFI